MQVSSLLSCVTKPLVSTLPPFLPSSLLTFPALLRHIQPPPHSCLCVPCCVCDRASITACFIGRGTESLCQGQIDGVHYGKVIHEFTMECIYTLGAVCWLRVTQSYLKDGFITAIELFPQKRKNTCSVCVCVHACRCSDICCNVWLIILYSLDRSWQVLVITLGLGRWEEDRKGGMREGLQRCMKDRDAN